MRQARILPRDRTVAIIAGGSVAIAVRGDPTGSIAPTLDFENRLHVAHDNPAADDGLIRPIDDGDLRFDAIDRRLDNRPFGSNVRDADHGFHL